MRTHGTQVCLAPGLHDESNSNFHSCASSRAFGKVTSSTEHTPDCLENTFASHLESAVVLGKSATFDDLHNPQANFKPNNGVEFKDGWIMKESKFTITRHARFSQFKYLCIQNFGF